MDIEIGDILKIGNDTYSKKLSNNHYVIIEKKKYPYDDDYEVFCIEEQKMHHIAGGYMRNRMHKI